MSNRSTLASVQAATGFHLLSCYSSAHFSFLSVVDFVFAFLYSFPYIISLRLRFLFHFHWPPIARSLSLVLKRRHLSSSFRPPSCFPKGAAVCEFCSQGRLVSGKPLLLNWSPAPGGYTQIISQITDDMWKCSSVKTLGKTFPHQSLTIRERDRRGLNWRKTDSRKEENWCLLLIFSNLWEY